MPALSFVHSDGSTQSKVVNKKLIRTHIARRFHTERSERLREKPRIARKQVPRWLAPQPNPIASQDVFLVERQATSDTNQIDSHSKYQKSPIATTAEILPHPGDLAASATGLQSENAGSLTFETPQNSVYSERETIEDADGSIEDLLRSNEAEVSAEEHGLSSTIVRRANQWSLEFPELTLEDPETQNRAFASVYPQIIHFLPSRSLGTPVMVSASSQARSLVEQFATRVDECAKVRGLMPSMLPLRNAYMPAARYHNALWYASVYFASATNQIYQRIPVNTVSLRFKGETIRAINSYLDDLSRQTTDEMIAAVLCLASIDGVCGNIEDFRIHLRAVGDMVRLRGGLDSLGFNLLLGRLIEMCEWRWDLVAHNSTGSILPCSSRAQPLPTIPPNIFALNSLLSNLAVNARPVSALLIQLQSLAISWDLQPSLSYQLARTTFDTSCKSLYDRLTVFGPPGKLKQLWTVTDYEYESFRLACLLYSANGAESEQTRLQNRQRRVSELYQCLRLTEVSKYWTDIPGALLWCLAVGVTESWDCPEYSWFMVNLIPVLMTLSMECWTELQKSLNALRWLINCSRKRMVLSRT